jgi:hypothetical protein
MSLTTICQVGFLPLEHRPGEAQVYFGTAYFYENGRRLPSTPSPTSARPSRIASIRRRQEAQHKTMTVGVHVLGSLGNGHS